MFIYAMHVSNLNHHHSFKPMMHYSGTKTNDINDDD